MQDTVRLIKADELQPQPWKNGGGLTRQIAIYPPGAGLADFIWRISAAEVSAPGPFSIWQDIDRILLLTDGGPMQLTQTQTGRQTQLDPGARLYFAGETPYVSALPVGPVRDFNLMLRRKQAHGCVDLRKGAQQLPLRPGDTVLHCTHGQFQAVLPARLGGTQMLETGDTLHITLDYVPAFTLNLVPLTPDACLVDARINLYGSRAKG